MGELKTFTLPGGTALRGDRIGALTRSDVVVVCSPEDEYLVRAALKLPDVGVIDDALVEEEMKRRVATSSALPEGSSSDRPARPYVEATVADFDEALDSLGREYVGRMATRQQKSIGGRILRLLRALRLAHGSKAASPASSLNAPAKRQQEPAAPGGSQ